MIRTALQVFAALVISAGGFDHKREAAEELVRLGRVHGFDPLTEVALVERESRWIPSVVGKLGEVGLGQVRVNVMPACRERGERCERYRESLFDWRVNLRATAALIAGWRAYCFRLTGSRLARYWLAGYAGRSGVCGHVKRAGRLVPAPFAEGDRKLLARREEIERLAKEFERSNSRALIRLWKAEALPRPR